MHARRPVGLVILDGFGYTENKEHNAIAHADMPHFKTWWRTYPHVLLQASGTAVGLPDNFCGNSEVGHLTIGAGRIIDQPMKIWLSTIADGSFAHNSVMVQQFKQLCDAGGTLHIMGLLSDAGVHAHEKEIHASIDAAVNAGIKKIVVHAFLDGRDVLPQSAQIYLQHLADHIKRFAPGQVLIGSLHGRFYAMDRDNHWDRIEKSYRVLTEKMHGPYEHWEKVLERNYAHNITDEFIEPTQLIENAYVHNGDGIFFCNVRSDRARELTACFVQPTHSGFNEKSPSFTLKPLNLTFFMTPVEYDVHLPTVALFQRPVVENTLKDILAAQHKTIFTIAETEKYAHVTYFFRGENEEPVATETRVLVPSLHVHDYKNDACMSAQAITQNVVDALHSNQYDFYLINYANADMVGHSGDFDATVKAVECLDKQLGILYELLVQKMNGTLYITADHGKAEQMYDERTGQPFTAHTSNPVPFVMLQKGLEGDNQTLPLSGLADIAPFIVDNIQNKEIHFHQTSL
jgi:2,3-bisphosphoglycerate-independent phosphoglycerate mutase